MHYQYLVHICDLCLQYSEAFFSIQFYNQFCLPFLVGTTYIITTVVRQMRNTGLAL